jgi:hypothetical protein
MSHYYTVSETDELKLLMREIDGLQARIDEKKPMQPERWQAVTEKLKMEWTYDSNAIEGSTLTLGETIFFSARGFNRGGKAPKGFC